MARDPRSDPQPGDRLSLGGALARVVVAVDGARVSWTLEARGPDNGRVRSCSLEHWRRTFRAPLPMPSPDALDGWDRLEKARRCVA